MDFNKSFTPEEGIEVGNFILVCLKECDTLTTEQLWGLVHAAFPKVDHVSVVYHITRELVNVGKIVHKERYELRR
ncbi:TPA: hypothetical protein DHW62_01630 [candidate division WWE3 bacterium]|nr:hypothetical protein [candidate division WWE3 bacterium]